MNILEVFILAFIEGVTEFLPVSSTGHLIIGSSIMGFNESLFAKNFNIVIQFGAILAVLVVYHKKFLENFSFYKKIFVAFIPAAIIGLLIKDKIDAILGSVTVVAWALIIGGIVLVLSDAYIERAKRNLVTIEQMTLSQCLAIGLFQCLAFIPGVSRSASTILGGVSSGLTKEQAVEFSFFIAVPTLTGAAFLKMVSNIKNFDSSQLGTLALGTLLSFVFALIAIHFFIKIVNKYGFKYFGYYRIVLGCLILLF